MSEAGDPVLAASIVPPAGCAAAPTGLSFLQCPRCAGNLRMMGPDGLMCEQCHTPVLAPNGIIDFVAGSAATQLDNIDYDSFYPINQISAKATYTTIRSAAGPLWPADLGDAVEIGAGTGGFTMAVLRECSAGHVVVTDISIKMLGLCRARMAGFTDLRAQGMTFATFGATQACFRRDAFDTCFGTAVVHHITDVSGFLDQVYRFLKPGGRAFFMEPNLAFHKALTGTLAAILADWARDGSVPRSDITLAMNWLSEVHCNIVNTGDLEVLAEREDKHFFVGETVCRMAAAAGFGLAAALPCALDPTGLATILLYMEQTGVSPAARASLGAVWPAAQDVFFKDLPATDRSPSYLFWLEKRPRKGSARYLTPASGDPDNPPDPAALPPPAKASLTFTLRRQDDGLSLGVQGWCLAVQRVKSVRVSANGRRLKLPVWRPRLDVQININREGLYPPLHAFCSGVEGTLLLAASPATDQPVQVIFDLLTADGEVMRGRSVRLVPDGASRTIEMDRFADPHKDEPPAA